MHSNVSPDSLVTERWCCLAGLAVITAADLAVAQPGLERRSDLKIRAHLQHALLRPAGRSDGQRAFRAA